MLNALGDLGDFVSGIAVVITLAYLATQVRQHTAVLRTASRLHLSAAYRSHNEHLLDPQLSEVYALGLRDYPDLTAAQKRTFTHAINDHTLFLQSPARGVSKDPPARPYYDVAPERTL